MPELTEAKGAPEEDQGPLVSGVVLPDEPSIEELARDWTLAGTDIGEVLLCRGADNCLRFALQLGVLRRYGRFLEEYDDAPVRIVNHLAAQLHLPPVLLLAPPRPATESEYRDRLRRYLSLRDLDQTGRDLLAAWVSERMADGESPETIATQAEQVVRGWHYVLPRATVFTRMISSFCVRAEGNVFERIAAQVSAEGQRRIDELLAVPEEDQRSMLFHLKEYPPHGNAQTIKDYLAYYRTAMGTWDMGEIKGVSQALIQHLWNATKRHDAWYLKRLPETKRYAMVTCFLLETRKTVLDHLIEMNDQHLTKLIGDCRKAADEQQRHYWKLTRQGQDLLVGSMEWMLEQKEPTEAWSSLLERTPAAELHRACTHYRESRRLEQTGYVGVLRERLRWQVRPYLPEFLRLPFQAEAGAAGLQQALASASVYFRDKTLPPQTTPVEFLPAAFRRQLLDTEGNVVPEVWELGLAVAVRDAVRARELYLSGSRRYVSFWNMVYSDEQWARERQHIYGPRSAKADCDAFLDRMQRELDQQAAQTEKGLPDNHYASMKDGRLKLSKDKADLEPESTKQLRRIIESHLRQIRIERLLLEVNDLCGFTKQLRPLNEHMPQWENTVAVLIAAIIAHGTNLGIVAMSHSTDGITLEMLRHVSQWCLRPETLKATNRVLVDFHHRLPISAVWGTGVRSSSDGQRFGLQEDSKIGAYYPRYFGYYGNALTLYTHMTDQFGVYSTQPISCIIRESLYVLGGLLGNDTIVRPKIHHTDTHGATHQIFGLFRLLGLSLQPRLAKLRHQRLFKLRKDRHYGELEPLFDGSVPEDLIREQWDGLMRMTASLRTRHAAPDAVVQRLANASGADRLAKALTGIGKVDKTIFLLRWFHDPERRGDAGLQLNRGEHRQSLAKWLFFANQGEFREGDYEEIMNKASCLSLISNAVLVWNTIQIQRIVEELRASGHSVKDDDLARVSPLLRAHVIPNGSYDLSIR
jgi:TnpA family transposase